MQLPPNLLLSVISPHAPPLIVACCSSPLNLGVDTFVKPRPPLPTNRMDSQSSTASSFTWRAHPDVPDRVRYTLEKVGNAFPRTWLRERVTGEIFQALEECERRLVAFSLSQGFDVVTGNSAKKPFPRKTFVCSHHGAETRNFRELPDEVERNEEKVIIGERQRELTSVLGTDYRYSCIVSFKPVRRGGERAFILTVKSLSHSGHPLANNPLVYLRHRQRLPEYQAIKAQAQAHRAAVKMPYNLSQRVIESIDNSGLTLTRKEYYNLTRHRNINGRDDSIVDGLLYALHDAGFQYRCRPEAVRDDAGEVVGQRLIQIWFTHPKLTSAAVRFCAGSVLVIDAPFNTNKARLPIIVAVGVLGNGKTFPIAFSYVRGEDYKSYSFFWECLKAFWGSQLRLPAIP